jgi:hypothetical protein
LQRSFADRHRFPIPCNRASIKTRDPRFPAHCWVTGTDGSRISFVTANCSWIEVAIGVKNRAGPLDALCNLFPVAPFLETVSGTHTMVGTYCFGCWEFPFR